MEIYTELIIDGTSYKVVTKTRGRRVSWTRAFKRTESIISEEIPVKKVKTSTTRDELECWIRNLKRNLRKQRGK